MRFDPPVEYTHARARCPSPQQAGQHRNFFLSFCFDEIYLERFTGEWINIYVNKYGSVCIEMSAFNKGIRNAFVFG